MSEVDFAGFANKVTIEDLIAKSNFNSTQFERKRNSVESGFNDGIYLRVYDCTLDQALLLESLRQAKLAKYYKDANVWYVKSSEFKNYPELTLLPHLKQESIETVQMEEELLHSQQNLFEKGEYVEMKNRVYLDFIPSEMSSWSFKYKVRYDVDHNLAYLNKEDINDEVAEKIKFCRRRGYIEQFELEKGYAMTPGKQKLVEALTLSDQHKDKAYMLHVAMRECAREKAFGSHGAVVSFYAVLDGMQKNGLNLSIKEKIKLNHTFNQYVKVENDYKKGLSSFLGWKNRWIERNHNRHLCELLMKQDQNQIDEKLNKISLILQLGNQDDKLKAIHKILDDIYKHTENMMWTNIQDKSAKIKQLNKVFNKENFLRKIDTILKNGDLISSKDISIGKQAMAMAKMYADGLEKTFNSSVLLKNNLEYLKRDQNKIEELRNQYVQDKTDRLKEINGIIKDYDCRLVRTEVLNEFKADVPFIEDSHFNPLYVSMTRAERMELPDELKAQLKPCPFSGLLCVEDNENNRRAFARYEPTVEKVAEIKAEYDKKVAFVTDKLKAELLTFKEESNFLDGQKHLCLTESGERREVWLSLEQEPILVIQNPATKIEKRLNLGSLSQDQLEKLNLQYEHKRQAIEALKKQDLLNEQKEMRLKLKELDATATVDLTKQNIIFLEENGLTGEDLGGYIDTKGKFNNRFDADPEQPNLIVPMMNSQGQFVNSVAINSQGEEQFLLGDQIKGNFVLVGKQKFADLQDAENIIFCIKPEDAAAFAKHAPEGTVVVAAMNNSNLPFVAKEIAHKNPKANIGFIDDPTLEQVNGQGPVQDAILNAQRAIEDLKPFTEVFQPPLPKADYVGKNKSLAAAQKYDAEKVHTMVQSTCVELRAKERMIVDSREEGNKFDKVQERIEINEQKLQKIKNLAGSR